MTITICGSIVFMDQMIKVQEQLLSMGIKQVYIPVGFAEGEKKSDISEEDGSRKIEHNLIKRHHDKILKSDAILVLNYDKNGIENYIGGNTLLELGFAFVNDKKIFLLNPIPNMQYSPEIIGMQPSILNGDLTKIVL